MEDFSGYIYSAMWFIIAIYLFYQAFRQSKFMFFLSAFFLYMSIWYLIDTLMPDINLFEGIYVIIFRCIAAVVLIVCITVYVRYKREIAKIMNENNK